MRSGDISAPMFIPHPLPLLGGNNNKLRQKIRCRERVYPYDIIVHNGLEHF